MSSKQDESEVEDASVQVSSNASTKDSSKKSDKEVGSQETVLAEHKEEVSRIIDATNTTKTTEHKSVVGDTKNLGLNQASKECDSLSVKCTSPLVAKVSAENRQFQKTRSFSAVEDNPEKKMIKVPSGKSGDFCFKDVAHSRSEQLDTTNLNSPEVDQDGRKSRAIDGDDTDCRVKDSEKRKSADKCRLMDQLSYFSDAQPMSLQHDSSYCREFDLERKGSRDIRKSGRDLSNLSAHETGESLERPKSSRATTRARLATPQVTHLPHNPNYYFDYLFFSTLCNISFHSAPLSAIIVKLD